MSTSLAARYKASCCQKDNHFPCMQSQCFNTTCDSICCSFLVSLLSIDWKWGYPTVISLVLFWSSLVWVGSVQRLLSRLFLAPLNPTEPQDCVVAARRAGGHHMFAFDLPRSKTQVATIINAQLSTWRISGPSFSILHTLGKPNIATFPPKAR